MVALGGCVVAPGGQGGMHGCSRGACMVALGGHVWLLLGGHAWLLWGVCVVARGRAWLLPGGVSGFFDEIRSMSGRYASYWNAFLFRVLNSYSGKAH